MNSIFTKKYLDNKCTYCSRQFNDKQSLLKHQTLCRRLSHNRLKNKYYSAMPGDYFSTSSPNATFSSPSSTSLFTECPKCKASMSTYDYLLHNCTKKQASNESTWSSTQQPNLRHSFRADSKYNTKKFSDFSSTARNSNNRKSFSSFNTTPTANTSRKSYDTVNTSSSSSGLGASFSSSTNGPTMTSNLQSDFVYYKPLRTASMSTSKKQEPQVSTASPKRSSKVILTETENLPSKPAPTTSSTPNIMKKSFSTTDKLSSESYTSPKINQTSNSHEQQTRPTIKQQTSPSKSTTSSYSSSNNKPFVSTTTPNYSKSSRLSSMGITNILNNSYTALKREKLRTGF